MEFKLEDIEQIVKQAVQAAVTETATQVAAQISQQISQAATKAATTSQRIENADIGGSERLEADQMSDSGLLFANKKRTYDEYQDVSLSLTRKLDNISVQALQNAVETANMVGKQAVRHGDISIDRIWNIDEVSDLSAKTGVQSDLVQAIASSVAAAVLAELKPKA